MSRAASNRYGIGFAFSVVRDEILHAITISAQRGDASMTARGNDQGSTQWNARTQRRQQLRSLLLAAADGARQNRRMSRIAARITQPMSRAVRDRIATLVSAAG